MRRSHRQVISEGGAEGIQCLSRTGEGLGVAIKVEDGARRAKQAAYEEQARSAPPHAQTRTTPTV